MCLSLHKIVIKFIIIYLFQVTTYPLSPAATTLPLEHAQEINDRQSIEHENYKFHIINYFCSHHTTATGNLQVKCGGAKIN